MTVKNIDEEKIRVVTDFLAGKIKIKMPTNKPDQPGELLQYNGYFVDFRLREFRTISEGFIPIEFIGFESEKGKEMLKELFLLDLVPAEIIEKFNLLDEFD